MELFDFLKATPEYITPFKLFSINHLVAILYSLIFIILPSVILKNHKFERFRKAYRYVLFIMIIIVEVLYKVWNISVAGKPLKENLSLHLCAVTIILCAITLINKNEKIFEVTFFWGLAGATQAIITPDLGLYGFPHYKFIHNFFSHSLIVAVVFYMIMVERLRPRKGAIKRIIIFTNIYMLFVGIINYLLGTNYLYISKKPDGTSLLNFLGPWPWYIVSLEIIAVILFILLYSPYKIKNILNSRKEKAYN